jgi:hypothetical protein
MAGRSRKKLMPLGVSSSQDGILKKAVYQDGRRILTDPVMARKLFNNYYSKKN